MSDKVNDDILKGLENFNNMDEEEEEEVDIYLGLFNDDDDDNSEKTASMEESIDFDTFLTTNYHGIICKFNTNNFETTKSPPLIVAFHEFNQKCTQILKWSNYLHDVALEYKDRIQFGVADLNDISILKLQSSAINNRPREVNRPPVIYGIDKQNRIFDMRKFVTVDHLKVFSEHLWTGALFKSEPEVGNCNRDLAKVAVASNFEKLVLTHDVDVFVTFYAPWCYFSTELMPRLDELAQLLKDENIHVVKINTENNYIHRVYNITCYPTSLYMQKLNKQKPIKYQGGPRTIENLLKFVAANSTTELRGYDRQGHPKMI